MSLGTQLVRAVQKEAAMQRPLPMTARVQGTLPKGGQAEAEVVMHDNDRFSHMAGELKVKTIGGKTAASPQGNAEAFCNRAGYLTERLQYVENDSSGKAIIRSTPGSMRGPRSEYFEGRVGENEVSLKRYKPHADKPGREAVPFCVTDEVLERLTDDAAGALGTK